MTERAEKLRALAERGPRWPDPKPDGLPRHAAMMRRVPFTDEEAAILRALAEEEGR